MEYTQAKLLGFSKHTEFVQDAITQVQEEIRSLARQTKIARIKPQKQHCHNATRRKNAGNLVEKKIGLNHVSNDEKPKKKHYPNQYLHGEYAGMYGQCWRLVCFILACSRHRPSFHRFHAFSWLLISRDAQRAAAQDNLQCQWEDQVYKREQKKKVLHRQKARSRSVSRLRHRRSLATRSRARRHPPVPSHAGYGATRGPLGQ